MKSHVIRNRNVKNRVVSDSEEHEKTEDAPSETKSDNADTNSPEAKSDNAVEESDGSNKVTVANVHDTSTKNKDAEQKDIKERENIFDKFSGTVMVSKYNRTDDETISEPLYHMASKTYFRVKYMMGKNGCPMFLDIISEDPEDDDNEDCVNYDKVLRELLKGPKDREIEDIVKLVAAKKSIEKMKRNIAQPDGNVSVTGTSLFDTDEGSTNVMKTEASDDENVRSGNDCGVFDPDVFLTKVPEGQSDKVDQETILLNPDSTINSQSTFNTVCSMSAGNQYEGETVRVHYIDESESKLTANVITQDIIPKVTWIITESPSEELNTGMNEQWSLVEFNEKQDEKKINEADEDTSEKKNEES